MKAVDALSALAQETRLRLFRLLVAHGPAGLPAGALAESLGIPANTLSFHLSQLAGAGLIRSHRQGRRIVYAVEPEGIRELLAFLSRDCCGGSAELCGLPPVEGAAHSAAAQERAAPAAFPGETAEDPRR